MDITTHGICVGFTPSGAYISSETSLMSAQSHGLVGDSGVFREHLNQLEAEYMEAFTSPNCCGSQFGCILSPERTSDLVLLMTKQ